jgi:hypothetical protein
MAKHILSVSIAYFDPDGRDVRGQMEAIEADTDLSPSPLYPFPARFGGRLIELTEAQFSRFKRGRDVRIDLAGKQYVFTRLETDGSFDVEAILK